MARGLILLADGFETVEGLAYYDIMHRGLIPCDLVSISNNKEVTSSIGVKVFANDILENIDLDKYDFIYLPGGKLGVDNLFASFKVKQTILDFYNKDKLITAICAAPSILARMGLLDDKSYTCFPGFNCGKGKYEGKLSLVKSGKIFTARSMYYTSDLAEEVLRYYQGEIGVNRIKPGTRGI